MLVENDLKKLEKFDAAYFRGKNYFDGNDGAQNSLVFQVGEKYFKNNSGSNSSKIEIWKSKGLSSQSLNLSGTVGTANNIKMSNSVVILRLNLEKNLNLTCFVSKEAKFYVHIQNARPNSLSKKFLSCLSKTWYF